MKNIIQVLKWGTVSKKLTFLNVVTTLSVTAISAVYPLVSKLIFDLLQKQYNDNGFQNFDSGTFTRYFVLLVFVTFLQMAISQLSSWFSMRWWFETWNSLSQRMFNHVQTLSMTYFEEMPSGKLLERMSRGVSDVVNIAQEVITSIAPQVLYIIIASFFLFRAEPIFGFIVIIGAPLYFYITVRYRKPLNKEQDKVNDAWEQASKVRYESISNIKTVKSFAKEDSHSKKFYNAQRRGITAFLRRRRVLVIMNILRSSVGNISRLTVIGLGVYLTATGKMTLGTLIMSMTFIERAFGPLDSLARVYDTVQKNMRSVVRIIKIFDTESEIKDSEGAITLNKIKGTIEFKNLEFQYKDRKVIKSLNLKVAPGQTIAIVGKSGVGKSTIVKLLLRFYDPQKGQILIDGHDIKNITQKSLRDNIGVVMQDTAIFDDTAYNNITYAKPSSGRQKVMDAAKMAHAHDFISKLPKGYNTILGEKGVKLSGGEQQRVNISRAVLKNPPILILDEATSHLDSESEKLIQDALENLIKGRTTIIIAHRLSTVMKADQIVIIDKGKVAEMGTHDELIQKGEIYYQLFQIQSGGYLN